MLDKGTKELHSAVKKAYQLGPEGSGSCVSKRNTTKPHKQTGKRAPSTTRVNTQKHTRKSTPPPHTHTQKYKDTTKRLSFRHFRKPRTPELRGISQTVSYFFVNNFNA